VTRKRPALFRGRHFEDVIILLCVRWYLRYSLTYRGLEEIMAERNLSVDHVTIWRWVQRYAPILNQRIRREMRDRNRSWRVDETYISPSFAVDGVGGKLTHSESVKGSERSPPQIVRIRRGLGGETQAACSLAMRSQRK